ncbi:hypothetical protein R1sor_024700 [Riccia sorocarpa]|uniref:PGG domain-containing protein n=1 Tax=Riccia sorocarpa TaxID=122646 RepID=A0ABD3GV88_9MARC
MLTVLPGQDPCFSRSVRLRGGQASEETRILFFREDYRAWSAAVVCKWHDLCMEPDNGCAVELRENRPTSQFVGLASKGQNFQLTMRRRSSKSTRLSGRSASLSDSGSDDDYELKQVHVNQRALSKKLSYTSELRSLLREPKADYLKTSIAGGNCMKVGDLLQELLETEQEDPVVTPRLLRPEVTQVFLWAVADSQDRVVKLLTDREAVDAKSFEYHKALYDFAKEGNNSAVRQLLRYSKKVHKNSPEPHFKEFVNSTEDDGTKTRNTALHWACFKGHTAVVKELMNKAFLPELDLNSENGSGDTPLHLAITNALETKNLDIVDMLCNRGNHKLLLNKKNGEGKTAYQRLWEVAMDSSKGKEERDAAELMRQLLLEQRPVNDRREEAFREREYLQIVATSLLVGATLLVGLTFGGFLQMPRQPPDEDFIEPGATVFDPTSNLGSKKYWYKRIVDISRCFNSITFFMSIISIVASIRVMIYGREQVFIEKKNCELEQSIRVSSLSLMLAIAVAVVAFVSSGLANIPVAESGWATVISNWGGGKYVPLFQSTTLATCLLGSLFVLPLVAIPLWKDYHFFIQEYFREVSSLWKLSILLFSTAMIFSVPLLLVMEVLGVGLL